MIPGRHAMLNAPCACCVRRKSCCPRRSGRRSGRKRCGAIWSCSNWCGPTAVSVVGTATHGEARSTGTVNGDEPMRNFLRSWWPRVLSRRGGFVAPRLEQLENRIVFALSATHLPFTAFGTAHAAAALTAPNAFRLYDVHLNAGDVVNIAVSSQAGGGALQSNLRVFDATGHPLALDAQQGGDARLTFQAPAAGNYLVGVSSAGDDAYDPAVATDGQGGSRQAYSIWTCS